MVRRWWCVCAVRGASDRRTSASSIFNCFWSPLRPAAPATTKPMRKLSLSLLLPLFFPFFFAFFVAPFEPYATLDRSDSSSRRIRITCRQGREHGM